ncbi:hypothetical protein FTUN_4797 [Frigoriglobus tundricola]|uniref:Uncharacterized protein n=1 Tax=Frigoriglobus tundricola TaxID=2774151 RepID=A0A6M5YTA7_9BACT|nr:hypothetical protein FTUN_4797 [Frigoriglobus tundricola]
MSVELHEEAGGRLSKGDDGTSRRQATEGPLRSLRRSVTTTAPGRSVSAPTVSGNGAGGRTVMRPKSASGSKRRRN